MGLDRPAAAEPAGLMDVYLRRSSGKEGMATLRGQLRDLVRWAKADGIEIRHVWFEEVSASKAHVRRREFEKATQAIMSGESRTLGVWKVDRFDRRGMGAVGRMLDEFDRRQSRLVSVSEGLDSAKGGRVVFAILSEHAREEAKNTAKRVKIGHDSHKAEGRRGTGMPPFGLFSAPASGKVERHRDEYETARRLADLLLDGKTTKGTAHRLNEEGRPTRSGATWSPTAVSKLAQSPLFAGMVPVRQRRVDEFGNPLDSWKGYGDPLRNDNGEVVMCGQGVVTPHEWFTIKGLIAARIDESWANGTSRGRYLGAGSYRCGRMRRQESRSVGEVCGGVMSYRGGRYRCQVRETRGKAICDGVVTLAERIDLAVGEAWVNHVVSLAPDDSLIAEIVRTWPALAGSAAGARRSAVRKELEAARKRVRKLEDDFYLYGKVDEGRFEELGDGLRAVIEYSTAALAYLDAQADCIPLLQPEVLRVVWEGADMADRRMLLMTSLGEKGITVKPAARQGDHTPILDRLEFDWVSSPQAMPEV